MDKKNLFLFVLFLALATAMVVVLVQTEVSADEGTRAGGNYIGSDACQSCHLGNYTGWSQTHHPGAWDKLNNSSQMIPECRRCHVTGYNEISIGGFDPSTNRPVSMQGIQCEACHGPGEEHNNTPSRDNIVMSYSSYVCGAVCHQEEHHPYYEEWNVSGHSMSLVSLKGAGEVADDSCLNCHSADYVLAEFKGKPLPTLDNATYGVTCALCHDPHNAANPNQLRMPVDKLCDSCHNPGSAIPGDPIYHPQSSMRDGVSGVAVQGSSFMPAVECADCHVYRYKPTNITGHSFTPKAEACVVCHVTTPPIYSNETAQVQINEWNSNTWDRILEVQEVLFSAKNAIESVPELGFPTSTVDSAREIFEEANYSLAFVVADGSGGVHNPAFASDLLNFSESKSNEVLQLLTPGSVVGRVVDESGFSVEGVAVYMDGRLVATTTRNDGSFMFSYAPGTYSIELRLAGAKVGSIDSVVIVAGQVEDVGEITTSEDSLFAMLLIVIVVLFFFAIIVIYLLTRRQKTVDEESGEEEEPEKELEEEEE